MAYWLVLSRVRLCVTPWPGAHQFPLSMRILQARLLEWVVMPSSRVSSQLRDQTQGSCITGKFFTVWATREAQEYWSGQPIPSAGDLPDPGIKTVSCIADGFFTSWATRKAQMIWKGLMLDWYASSLSASLIRSTGTVLLLMDRASLHHHVLEWSIVCLFC